MCGCLASRKVRPVNATSTQITLELELDGETISGHAIDADGVRREFSGWIGLMGVLDAILQRAELNGSALTDSQHSRNGDKPC
jgi:hypothetical protein